MSMTNAEIALELVKIVKEMPEVKQKGIIELYCLTLKKLNEDYEDEQ